MSGNVFTDFEAPWFIPRLESKLFCLIPDGARPQTIPKGGIIVSEEDYPDKLVYVRKGVLEQSTVNYMLKKPFAVLSLCLAGTMTGRMLMLSKYASPVRITALRKSEVIIIPFEGVKQAINASFELYQMFTSYCSRCDQSEFAGMSIIGTRSAEERLKLFFQSVISAFPASADEGAWRTLPFKFSRNEIASITHTTRLTVDRVLAQWIKNGLYKNTGSSFLLHQDLFSDI